MGNKHLGSQSLTRGWNVTVSLRLHPRLSQAASFLKLYDLTLFIFPFLSS